jgi:glucokinase
VGASTSTPLAAGSDGAAAARSPVLGLDIGGTKLAAGVVDDSGRVHSFLVTPSEAARGPE